MIKNYQNIYLVGNPNSGKSTIFNLLTGLNQKISNLSGTTVEIKSGLVVNSEGSSIKIFDLPGVYSIQPNSIDEQLAMQCLLNPDYENKPDKIIFVADITNLKRHLLLFSQIADLGFETILILNFEDLAQKKGIYVNISRLELELGIKVLKMNARNPLNIEKLKALLFTDQFKTHFHPFNTPDCTAFLENKNKAKGLNNYQIFQIHYLETIANQDSKQKMFLEEQRSIEILVRHNAIDQLVNKTVKQTSKNEFFTIKADKWITHPIWGYLIFVFIAFIMFQGIFWVADFPMQYVEYLFGSFGEALENILPPGRFRGFLVNGLLAGLSGVLVFLPQIIIMFIMLSILEDTGYMSRVGFIMDRIMRKFGMNGRSIIPLISGSACAIPAIMATRSIDNSRDRLITILVTPFISCSARLPVYILLISMLPIANSFKGFFLMGMYILGAIMALIAGFILKKTISNYDKNCFFLELPIYQWPRWKNILITCWQKSKSFVTEAGKIIIIISIVLWFLTSFGPPKKYAEIDKKYETIVLNTNLNPQKIQSQKMSEKQEYSYAGYLGKAIEPAIAPLGFDWKIGIALITSFAAREVFVGSMATIYGAENENYKTIKEKMLLQNNKEGKPLYSLAVCLSLMVFYAFALQCISTLGVVYRETKTWKWPIYQLIGMSILAYVASFITYQFFK